MRPHATSGGTRRVTSRVEGQDENTDFCEELQRMREEMMAWKPPSGRFSFAATRISPLYAVKTLHQDSPPNSCITA